MNFKKAMISWQGQGSFEPMAVVVDMVVEDETLETILKNEFIDENGGIMPVGGRRTGGGFNCIVGRNVSRENVGGSSGGGRWAEMNYIFRFRIFKC